jgi:hypothetical protein
MFFKIQNSFLHIFEIIDFNSRLDVKSVNDNILVREEEMHLKL